MRRATYTFAALLLSCHAAPPATPHSVDLNSSPTLGTVADALPLSTTDVRTDGRIAKIRGQVRNPYAEEIEGVRYLIEIVSTTGEQPRTLESFHQESSQRIKPGDSTMMRFDLQSMYFGSTGAELSIVALPKKLGGHDVAPPSGWNK